jgi:ATP-dependent DNA helicase RecG
MVEIFDDRVEITNPGGLPKGLKPEEFGTKSVLRNPILPDLFHRAGYIERMGTGIGRMRDLMAEAGLPPMKFGFTAFFTATFLRPKPKETAQLAETFGIKFGIKGKRATRVADLLWRISSGAQVTAQEYASDARVSARAVEKDILLLRQRGLIDHQGSRKTGSYVLTDKGKALLKELGR